MLDLWNPLEEVSNLFFGCQVELVGDSPSQIFALNRDLCQKPVSFLGVELDTFSVTLDDGELVGAFGVDDDIVDILQVNLFGLILVELGVLEHNKVFASLVGHFYFQQVFCHRQESSLLDDVAGRESRGHFGVG